MLEAISGEGAEPWVHSCAPETPLALLRGAGARGLSVDLDQMGAADHEVLAEALDAGETVVLGVVPSLEPAAPPDDGAVTERVLRWLDMVGLDPATISPVLVVSPTCGQAGSSYQWMRQTLKILRSAASHLS